MVLSSNSDEIEKRLALTSARNGRYCYLSHLGLTDATLPMKALLSLKLTRLDLAYNFLQQIPASVGSITSLKELWLNNNPHLVSVPVSLANLTNLRVLDLKNTAVRNIPREYAVLEKMVDVNLSNCPLKPNLQSAYARGKETFFEYLRRKNDRRIYKEKLLRVFHDDIYPFEDVELALKPLVNNCFLELKDKTTPELRKLIRHGPRIFPDKIHLAEPKAVRREVERFATEDLRTQQTGFLQLKLRGLYPDCSVGDAAQKAAEIYRLFQDRPKDFKRLFGKKQKLLFPENFEDLSGKELCDRMEEMKVQAFANNIISKLRAIYVEATDEELQDLFEFFLECCNQDWDLLDRNLEKCIPSDLSIALEKMDDEVEIDFSDRVAPEPHESAEEANGEEEEGSPQEEVPA